MVPNFKTALGGNMPLTARGFTFVEVMIVVAILGIIAAIAIPQYLNYMTNSKLTTCEFNYETAIKYIRTESPKRILDNMRLPGYVSVDLVAHLNNGDKRNPYNNTLPMFTAGAAVIGNACQVGITNLGAGNILPIVDTIITVNFFQDTDHNNATPAVEVSEQITVR